MDFNPLRDPCFTCRLWQGKDSPCIRPKTYHKGALTFIGEAPGEQEDRKNEAFVGPAGDILREALAALGIDATRVNLLNAVKCRPTKDGKNRPPTAKEVKLCNEYLQEEMRYIGPCITIALGRVAAAALGLPDVPLRDLRNRRWTGPCEGATFVTYHPAYSLKPGMAHIKQEFTNDLKLYRSDLKPDIDKQGEVEYTDLRGKEITIDIETSGFFKDHSKMPFDGKGEILLIGVDGEHITD